jgi:hypothetical protein
VAIFLTSIFFVLFWRYNLKILFLLLSAGKFKLNAEILSILISKVVKTKVILGFQPRANKFSPELG